jgi:hypothetical protein
MSNAALIVCCLSAAGIEVDPAIAEDEDAAQALMQKPGVMDQYDGFMHAFHDIPVEGCGSSRHSGPDYEAGFRHGLEHPDKPARDAEERAWREWKPS